jgi:hypothetical protein
MTLSGRLPYWAVLAFLATLGLLGLIAPALLGWTWDHGVISGIATALFIAAVLGATIDRWMKAEIASDVFHATLGYIMPAEFQAEISKITSFQFICDTHEMWYDVHLLTPEIVSVRVRCERSLRNITNTSQLRDASVHIDEWGFSHQSAIQRCEIHDSAGQMLKTMAPVEVRDDSTLRAKTDPVSVEPGQTIKVVTDYVEIRRINDQIVTVFLSPTKNPRVHLNCPNFQFVLDFGVLEQRTGVSAVSTTHTLNGVYFPPAAIRLRWWPVRPQN